MTKKPTPTQIRSSSIGQLWLCAPSVLTGGDTIRTSKSDVPADVGKVVHACMATLIPTGEYDLLSTASAAGLTEEPANEARSLAASGAYLWRTELGKYFSAPQAERLVEGPVLDVGGKLYQLTGTIDVLSPAGENGAVFIDWKTGRVDMGFHQQMTSYAYLLWCHMGRPDEVKITGIVALLRMGKYRVLKFDAAALKAWEYDLTRNVLGRPNEYHPGRQCNYCPVATKCPARKAVVMATIEEIMAGAPADRPGEEGWLERSKKRLLNLTERTKLRDDIGGFMADMLFKIKICEDAAASTRQLLRDTLERVGDIKTAHGTVLRLKEVTRRDLDTRTALPILGGLLSKAQIADCTKISMAKAIKIYADTQRTGTKKAAREKLTKLLEPAVRTKTHFNIDEAVDGKDETNGRNSGDVTE